MATYTQENRDLAVDTPLGKDVLLLTGFSGGEGISQLSSFHLGFLSRNDSIAPADIVGKNITVSLRLLDGGTRYFNGYVSAFAYVGADDRLSRYAAEVVPWLWFLTRTADCRIFQKLSVPKILEKVFQEMGFQDFETAGIKGTHPERTYCVQYRETDFAFVSRLMEEEGIFYWFRHQNGKHVMVLADAASAYQACPEGQVEFTGGKGEQKGPDLLTGWEHGFQFRSGRCTSTDYNHETPSANLLASSRTLVKLNGVDKFELFDYPGLHARKNDGDTLAKLRMEEEEAGYEVVQGSGYARTFSPGGKFTVSKHPRKAEEGKGWVLTTVQHRAMLGEVYTSGSTGEPFSYQNSFSCIPDAVTFRPPRVTPRPVLHGVQTAVVVGPPGEEIHTDSQGRVKVQFFWDREGKKDDKSSCWVRVAQAWAGKSWGAFHIPRIGQEVVVSFQEGDPDRPLVTGAVYNAEQTPPYALPDKKTVSTLKSSSSPGGSGANEIRFDDTAGEEQLYIHVQKDSDLRVEHDERSWIGNDSHLTVKHDQVEAVENDRSETVGGSHSESITGDRSVTVKGAEALEIGGKQSMTVKGDVSHSFKGAHTEETTGKYTLNVTGEILIESKQKITLQVGGSKVVIDNTGVKVEGTGMAELKSPMTTVKGDGTLVLKGGLVNIN